MTEFRICQVCRRTAYRVRPEINGYSLGPQDVCPGCAVRRRAGLGEDAKQLNGRPSSLRVGSNNERSLTRQLTEQANKDRQTLEAQMDEHLRLKSPVGFIQLVKIIRYHTLASIKNSAELARFLRDSGIGNVLMSAIPSTHHDVSEGKSE